MHYLSHASMTKIYMKAHSLNNTLVKDMLVGKIFQDCSSDVPLYLFYCFYKSISILKWYLDMQRCFSVPGPIKPLAGTEILDKKLVKEMLQF